MVLLKAESYLATGDRAKCKATLKQLRKQIEKWDRTIHPDEKTKARFEELLAGLDGEQGGTEPG